MSGSIHSRGYICKSTIRRGCILEGDHRKSLRTDGNILIGRDAHTLASRDGIQSGICTRDSGKTGLSTRFSCNWSVGLRNDLSPLSNRMRFSKHPTSPNADAAAVEGQMALVPTMWKALGQVRGRSCSVIRKSNVLQAFLAVLEHIRKIARP